MELLHNYLQPVRVLLKHTVPQDIYTINMNCFDNFCWMSTPTIDIAECSTECMLIF